MMTTHDEYRLCRVAVRKTEAHLELKLVNNLKGNKKGLSKHASRKKEDSGKGGPNIQQDREMSDKGHSVASRSKK